MGMSPRLLRPRASGGFKPTQIAGLELWYAPYIERSHPMLVPLGSAIGLTQDQIDAAFVEAARL